VFLSLSVYTFDHWDGPSRWFLWKFESMEKFNYTLIVKKLTFKENRSEIKQFLKKTFIHFKMTFLTYCLLTNIANIIIYCQILFDFNVFIITLKNNFWVWSDYYLIYIAGTYCELDFNACQFNDTCGEGRACIDLTPAQQAAANSTTGYNCSACLAGYIGNGSKCSGKQTLGIRYFKSRSYKYM